MKTRNIRRVHSCFTTRGSSLGRFKFTFILRLCKKQRIGGSMLTPNAGGRFTFRVPFSRYQPR